MTRPQSDLPPRYQVLKPEHGPGFLITKLTNHLSIERVYRTEHAAQEVADVLNKWAGQEMR